MYARNNQWQNRYAFSYQQVYDSQYQQSIYVFQSQQQSIQISTSNQSKLSIIIVSFQQKQLTVDFVNSKQDVTNAFWKRQSSFRSNNSNQRSFQIYHVEKHDAYEKNEYYDDRFMKNAFVWSNSSTWNVNSN